MMQFNQVDVWRKDFRLLNQLDKTDPYIYFDNAATSLTPDCVVEAVSHYYYQLNTNIHRGVYQRAATTTDAYEKARKKVADWINADHDSVIFTKSTTEGLNLITQGLVKPMLSSGDRIWLTHLEHHSNLVPWQMVAKDTGARLEYMPLKSNYQVDIEALDNLVDERVKVIAINHVSNVVGQIQPLQDLCDWAKARNIMVIVDGAQAVAHLTVDVQQLGVAAYCFSGHKMFGPTGIGVCYIHSDFTRQTQPLLYGGEMIYRVEEQTASFKDSPYKFEGGTPPIAQAIGLARAIDYIETLNKETIHLYTSQLGGYLYHQLAAISHISIYSEDTKCGIISFNIDGVHPHDAATAYDQYGIALRAGHHCCQPLMRQLQIPACLRASLSFYNTKTEVDQFIYATKEIEAFFNGELE